MFINTHKFAAPEAVAPAGSTAADATALSKTAAAFNVTGADATKGVILPTKTGEQVLVRNLTAAILKIYPATGGTINRGAANAAYSLAASKDAILVCTALDTWSVFVSP